MTKILSPVMAKKALSVGFLYDDSLDRNDGVSQVVRRLGGWLSSQGHDVSYLVGETSLSNWSGGRIYSLSRNIKVSFNGNRLSMPLYSKAGTIRRALAENRFDVVHVQMPYSPLMAARVIKRLPSTTAVVGTFHILPSGPLARLGSRALSLLLRRTLRRFDAVMSTSPAAAAFAKSHYGLDSLVVPNMVDTKSFALPDRRPSDDKTIVFLGRLVERKGCALLVDAFSELAKTRKLKLIVGGSGPQLPKLKAQVARLGIADKVTFTGFVNEEDKPGFLNQADIACFPSVGGESFGIVLIEAMAAGAGVVLGGDNPGYSSVLGEQPKLLINPRNKKKFANRLEELLNDRQLVESLHRWQQETLPKYDTAVVGQQTIDLYARVIAKRAAKRHN